MQRKRPGQAARGAWSCGERGRGAYRFLRRLAVLAQSDVDAVLVGTGGGLGESQREHGALHFLRSREKVPEKDPRGASPVSLAI